MDKQGIIDRINRIDNVTCWSCENGINCVPVDSDLTIVTVDEAHHSSSWDFWGHEIIGDIQLYGSGLHFRVAGPGDSLIHKYLKIESSIELQSGYFSHKIDINNAYPNYLGSSVPNLSGLTWGTGILRGMFAGSGSYVATSFKNTPAYVMIGYKNSVKSIDANNENMLSFTLHRDDYLFINGPLTSSNKKYSIAKPCPTWLFRQESEFVLPGKEARNLFKTAISYLKDSPND